MDRCEMPTSSLPAASLSPQIRLPARRALLRRLTIWYASHYSRLERRFFELNRLFSLLSGRKGETRGTAPEPVSPPEEFSSLPAAKANGLRSSFGPRFSNRHSELGGKMTTARTSLEHHASAAGHPDQATLHH